MEASHDTTIFLMIKWSSRSQLSDLMPNVQTSKSWYEDFGRLPTSEGSQADSMAFHCPLARGLFCKRQTFGWVVNFLCDSKMSSWRRSCFQIFFFFSGHVFFHCHPTGCMHGTCALDAQTLKPPPLPLMGPLSLSPSFSVMRKCTSVLSTEIETGP